MDKQITPEIKEQLETLCAEISVAQKLDQEVQEELYGHLEDKYLAYMNKEEEVGPQDAVILVQEHFGDAATVQEMLRDVHEQVPGVSFWRGIAAIIFATTGVSIIWQGIVAYLYFSSGMDTINGEHTSHPIFTFYSFLIMVTPYLVPLISFLLLYWWTRKQNAGAILWYQKYSTIVMLLLGLFILSASIGLCWYPTWISYRPPGTLMFFQIYLLPVFSAYLWIWWMRHISRAPGNSIWVLLIWISFSFIGRMIILGFLIGVKNNPHFLSKNAFGLLLLYILCATAALCLYSLYLSMLKNKLTIA